MTIRNLDKLFSPRSVAVIGASERPGRVGTTVLRNIVAAGFKGPVFPINPKYGQVAGIKAYGSVDELPAAPELAVICTPPETIPRLVAELGARGTKAAVVITAGLDTDQPGGRSVKQRMLEAAAPNLLRILGPNCLGLIVPGISLNASFAPANASSGNIAFVSQSGALVTSVLDWANSEGIGFSHFISLGESADVDFGDVLDYLARDADTHAVLMYMESVTGARKFMSAARAAARVKPVLVLKSGRAPESAKAATSHTGALAGSDDVYDAAIRRAGMVRVFSTEDLFDTVETLARARPLRGDRLAVMSNGGGPAVMAVDALCLGHGRLAELPAETCARLDAVLPPTWSHANPVDLIGDAPVQRYVDTMEILLDNDAVDAVLFIHSPTAVVDSTDIAAALLPLVTQRSARNVIACWLGGDGVQKARSMFGAAGIPTYNTPEEAVHAFLQIVEYRRNQELLMEVPSSVPDEVTPDHEAIARILADARSESRAVLYEHEAKAVIAACGVTVVETRHATSPEQAASIAQELGFPVALKIVSPDITHKSDVNGVALNLGTSDGVRNAAESMQASIRQHLPDARLRGFTVERMVTRPGAQELIAGIASDRTFGPVLLVGEGGTAVEIKADRAIGLPPLNMVLAQDMLSRTRVSRLLAGYRNHPPANVQALCRVLVQLSHLVAAVPEIVELDINPLLVDSQDAIALDARIRIAVEGADGANRFAIRPYPEELEEWITWQEERILLRPIKPEDGAAHIEFFRALDREDVRLRFFSYLGELVPAQLARFTQIDYDREMAFIATRSRAHGGSETLGVVRGVADPDNERAEFAIIVRSDLKGRGLGSALMRKLIDYFASRGTTTLVGEMAAGNQAMARLATDAGFEIGASRDHDTLPLTLQLAQARSDPATRASH